MIKFKVRYLLVITLLTGFACSTVARKQISTDQVKRIVILYTNDEHGWMEATKKTGGAAGLVGLWKQKEGYSKDGPFLVLSGGDNLTGPAISTWYKGESMSEVMKSMDYTASTIGNHEFDFNLDDLKILAQNSSFPYLSANIRNKNDNKVPGFAKPYIIKEINGVKIGIIGLTTTLLPELATPTAIADFKIIDYSAALTEFVPQIRQAGAELIVLIAHIPFPELKELIPIAKKYGISVLGAGHDHHREVIVVDKIAVIESGYHLVSYAKVDILFDTKADTVVQIHASTEDNVGSEPDSSVTVVVNKWRVKVDQDLSQVIGYTSEEIPQYSKTLSNMITDSWLHSASDIDITFTNVGGIRQSIPPGNITLAVIVGVLPFENNLVKLELTGNQLVECTKDLVFGGMTMTQGYRLSNGEPIIADSIYNVLTTDYLYSRSDYCFSQYDNTPYYTSFSYRQPVIDWIKSMNTTLTNPLNSYLNSEARK
jgi:5'-nucleotidase / UDP-sugar diphosphatase